MQVASLWSARIALSTLLVISSSTAFAQTDIPRTISHQGVLVDSTTGNPVDDGSYDITFRLYESSSGGTAVWTETQSVATTNGVYGVLLGTVTPLASVQFNREFWLSVQVAPDAEMTDRTQLAGVPFSLGLALPFADTVSSADPLLRLNNTGTADGILVTNTGSGTAGAFVQLDPGATSTGVYGQANGQGAAIFGQHFGTGPAGKFVVSNASSDTTALYVETTGTGPAAVIHGSVGVGTDTPDERLHVDGVIKADSVIYTAALKGFASIHSSAFQNQDNGQNDATNADIGFWYYSGSAFASVATIQLPHNAKLETISCRLYDTASVDLVCKLCQSDGNCSGGGLGSVTSSGTSGAVLYTGALTGEVDNSAQAYYVHVETSDKSAWGGHGNDLRILRVTIGYEIGGAP